MDITLSKTQQDIAKEARRFLQNECSINFIEEMFQDDKGYTDKLWSKIVELDWPAMCIPEKYDGMGMDLIDLVMVLEETGRALMPGPFFSTVLYAAETILAAGSESQKETYLPKIVNGEIKGTVAIFEPDSGSDPSYIQMEAESDTNGYILNGPKMLVSDAHVADFIICAVRTTPGDDPSNGISLFMVDAKADGVTVTLLPTMDSTRKYAAVEFKNTTVSADNVLGDVDKGWAPLSRAMNRAAIGVCAESLGGAQFAMEKATDYAKTRIQFGQPIGAFQAIKHRCAQMFVDVESSRSLLYYAAWAQDNEDPKTAAIAASAAKAYIAPLFNHVACGTIQVLGGTGFTWENGIHYYLKRAKANEVVLGDQEYHHERILTLLDV
jgi:alkylation response protein AidB-like acyl-CoA dehydrogenase